MKSKVINLNEYRESKQLENDYLKFLTYVNKYTGIPITLAQLVRVFFLNLRWLEGTVNCLSVLSIVSINDKEIEETKTMVIDYLNKIIEDIKNC